ncbi:MAG: nucleotidyl transferase AbiEii/AbiGii toxin family protein, partial [Trueperaceae bacterium]
MNVTATEPLWAALAAEGVEYALVGGLAMSVHGLPRFTEDIDIFVSLEKENVEHLKRALEAVFADPSIDGIAFE